MNAQYAYTPNIWPSLFTAIVLAALAAYGWRRRDVPSASMFALSCLFAALWAAGLLMEVAATQPETKIFWFKFWSVWQVPVVTAITCFVIEYAWPGRWLTRRNVIILFIPSLMILVTVMTNDLHHLVWRGFTYDERIVPERTRLDWLIITYAYALTILDIIILALLFHRSPQYRRPVAIMLAGQIIARSLYILYVAGIFPSGLLLQTPPVAFEYLMYAIALFGFHMFDPISLARRTAVEQIHAGMVVLDPKGTVVSLNPAARAMIILPEKRVLGRPVQELLPISDQMIQSGRFETSLGTGAETRHFQAETSALDDGRGLEVGRLLLLHEVTEQKKAEARLIEQQRVLATLRERERLARELHDELAQGLALINIQAQLVRDLLDAGQMEQAKEQLQVLAQAARDAHVDVRGEIGELAHGIRSEEGLTGALRRITENFQQVNGIQTELAFLGEGPLSPIAPTVEVQLMRIVQEALANIRKHARAKHVKVTLRKEPGCLELTIQDDGIGFDHSSLSASPRTFGLGIMSERAEEISGRVEMLSSVGMGTTVRVVVPLDGS